jgi:bidirectional [NiFe] hydrogenase diaphorase subunit
MAPESPTAPARPSSHPSSDQRFKLLEVAMKRHQYRQDALIEVLHAAQELFGYLERDLLHFVARSLKMPPSRVYGVATFYHFFTLQPKGKHTCLVCTGTACYVKGAGALLGTLDGEAHLHPGERTPDGQLSLATTRCVGTCGIAPVVVFDGTARGPQTPEALRRELKGWLADGTVGPG